MKWKPAVVLAAMSVALSFGASMPATAAGDNAPDSFRASGLLANAEAGMPDGGRLVVQVMDGTQVMRTPGAKPVSEALPPGVAAMGLPGPFDDPAVMAREVWCLPDGPDAGWIAADLTGAQAEFTCDAMFVDVVCTVWEEEECVGAEEILNEDLSDTLTVFVTWEGVGDVSRTLAINKSFGPDWWLSHTKGMERMAIASGSVRGVETTYFDGAFDDANLASIRDSSLQRMPAEPR